MNEKKAAKVNEKRLIKDYRGLAPELKTMVRILAVHVLEFRQKDMIACLKALGQRDPEGRLYTPTTLRSALKVLVDKGMIRKTPAGISCARDLRMTALIDTVGSREFKAVGRAVLSIKPFQGGYMEMITGRWEGFIRCLQFAVFNGQKEADLEDVWFFGMDMYPDQMLEAPPLFNLFNRPFRPELLDGLEKETLGKVLFFTLVETHRTLEPARDLLAYGCQFFMARSGMPLEKAKFMEVLLFHGHFKEYRALGENIQGANPIYHRVFQGCHHLVSDENDKAMALFNEGLGLLKKKTRKRKIFIPGLPGIFFLISLLKTGGADQFKTASGHIDGSLREKDIYYELYRSMKPLFGPLKSLDQEFMDAIGMDPGCYEGYPVIMFFHLLILAWIDPKAVKPGISRLKQFREKAARSGYDWLAAEAAMLLAQLGEEADLNRDQAQNAHAGLGTASLVDIVRPAPKWEKTLNALIRMGQAAGNPGDGVNGEGAQRMIWLLDYNEKAGSADISPRLQKRTKKNGWTKGRAVAMKKLYSEHRTLDWLTDQDRQVCGAIEESTYRTGYYSRYYNYTQTRYDFDPDSALAALAGHPLVFLAGDLSTPVELVEAQPEVRLKTARGKIKVSMDPLPLHDSRKTALVRETPTRFKLVCFTRKHLEVADLLGKTGLSLPKKAQTAAVRAMSSLSSMVQVNSDLAVDLQGQAVEIPADPMPHVHIMPFQEGISMEVLVRPFKDAGSYFRPGRGGAHVFAEKEGKRLSAIRNLSGEEESAKSLVSLCPTMEILEPVDGQWQAGDPEQALALLSELKNCEDKAVLEWPKGEKFTVASQAGFENFKLGIKKDRDWFKATGSLELSDDLSLDLKKLLALMDNAVGRFLPLDDKTFIGLTRSLKERLEELKSYGTPHGKGVRIAPLAAPAIEELADQAGRVKTDKAWKEQCKKLKEAVDPQLPSTLQAELRDYQKEGFFWLARLAHWQVGGCLADDMGLGKTLQALSAILLTAHQGPSLVVAPLSVMANWQDECHRFAPTLVPKFFGPGDRKAFLEDLGPFDLVVASYGLLQTEGDKLARIRWQTLVLDEAQAIKNMNTKRSRAAMKLDAAFRLITTGTPVENRLEELWTLFNFINPGLLGSFARFREEFALPIERDRDTGASRRLKKLIRPFILRRLKADVLKELPEKTEVTLHVEMSREEAVLYEAQRIKALENIEGDDSHGPGARHLKILAELTRLRRLCCNPALVLPEAGIQSSKLRVFSDTIDELLANRHKVLVFSQFVGHLKILEQHLSDKGILFQYLDGSTPAKERQKRINAFQSGQGEIFLISLKAGGAGLNLTAADYVIHMDPWWNPAVEDQASDRAHRIGQTRPVTVYRLVVKDSIEEKILNLHQEKRELAHSLLSGSDTAAKIDADTLLALLKGD